MARDKVRELLANPYEECMKTTASKVPTDAFDTLSIHVYYGEDFCCKGVEFFPPSNPIVDGHKLIGIPFSEVLAWLKSSDPGLEQRDSLIESKKYGFALYVPDAADDPDAVVESAYFFAGTRK
jgi:hypothetical protein